MKPKLELTWINKDQRPKLEPRVLVHDIALSYHAEARCPGDHFDNRLIFGDNLLGLKALEQELSGKVKCIYIDPPYNTGSAFEHYDDGVEHSIWLSLMRERMEMLRRLLSEDGSIWVSIDDREHAYLKVLMDEIFGRANFMTTVVWQKKYAPKSDSKHLSESHDFILQYAKNSESVKTNRLPKTEKQTSRYTNKDNDPRGPWKPDNVLRNEARDYAIFPVRLPSGRDVMPPSGTSWRYTKDKFAELIKDNRIWFGLDGNARPALKRFISEVTDTIPATTVWLHDEVGHNDESKKESRVLFGDDVFGTPKPERLVERILTLATDPGDLVLDSFAGSGTTGAVAHKMGRRWIMIEMGEHCHTHIIPRLKKVIDGTDQGGISKAVGWKGGGGFRYYRLAPTLIKNDQWGHEVINPQFNAEMVAEAVCKLEGFTFAPSESEFWRHGQSTENDFIYVTTQTLSAEQLDRISEEVGPKRSLLVCCGAWRAKDLGRWANLSLKKIPKAVLDKAEWDRDDYALAVSQLPVVEDEENGETEEPEAKPVKAKPSGQEDLFGASAKKAKPKKKA